MNYYPDIHFKMIYLARKRTGLYTRLYFFLTPIIRVIGKKRFDRYVDSMFLNMYNEIHIKIKKIA